jgi:hypothetical protein
MAQQTKIVTILPQEAAAAGCSATCTSYVENKTREVTLSGGDKAYRTFTNYYIEAFPAGLWKFKNFVATVTYSDTSGASHTYEQTWTPPNSGTIYPTSLHTDYETDPTDYTSVEPAGKHIDAQPTRSFSNVRAVFELNGWRITTSVSPVGGGTATGGGEVAKNSGVTLVATPSQGYAFDGWYENGSLVSSSATYSFTATRDRSLVAQFSMVNPVTVTLVAHNGWGQVKFTGETPTTGTVSKTVPAGTSVSIEAIRTGYPEYVFWRTPSGDSYGNPARTITPTSDVTYTAFFGYWCHAHAAELSAPETRVPVGEIQIAYTGGSSGWMADVSLHVLEGSTVTFNQRTSLVGWSFVKWRYRQGSSDWMETTNQSISNYSLSLGGLYAIALFQRTPTHLLVNSSTKESPAKLVYDPATNKLVADY